MTGRTEQEIRADLDDWFNGVPCNDLDRRRELDEEADRLIDDIQPLLDRLAAAEAELARLRAVVAAGEAAERTMRDESRKLIDRGVSVGYEKAADILRAALGAAVTPTPEATTDEEFETLDDELRGLTGTWVNDPHLDRSTAIRCANDVGAVLDLHLPAPVTGHPTDEYVEPCGDPGVGIGCPNPGCTHDGKFYDAAMRAAGHPTDEPPTQRYEPCVLGADGRCTRWSHDHAPAGRLVPQRDDEADR